MTVKEFKEFIGKNKNIKYFDKNDKDISDKPDVVIDLLTVIGSGHHTDGTVIVYVDYID